MSDIDYENYFNQGQYCILPSHTAYFCNQRFCKDCTIYLGWKNQKGLPVAQTKRPGVAIVGNPGLLMALTVGAAAQGRRIIHAETDRWEAAIAEYPLRTGSDYSLRTVCRPAADAKEASTIVKHLLLAMATTFRNNKPAGFAANQFGFTLRVIAFMYDSQTVICMINPEVLRVSDKISPGPESCFSVPDTKVVIGRPKWIKVRGLLPDGSVKTIKAHDYTARVICHEIDHLDGKLIIDYR